MYQPCCPRICSLGNLGELSEKSLQNLQYKWLCQSVCTLLTHILFLQVQARPAPAAFLLRGAFRQPVRGPLQPHSAKFKWQHQLLLQIVQPLLHQARALPGLPPPGKRVSVETSTISQSLLRISSCHSQGFLDEALKFLLAVWLLLLVATAQAVPLKSGREA